LSLIIISRNFHSNENKFLKFSSVDKGEWPTSPLVMPKQYGYHWIDLDEYYQSVNGLISIGGIPKEL
jgi:hypothetical protein